MGAGTLLGTALLGAGIYLGLNGLRRLATHWQNRSIIRSTRRHKRALSRVLITLDPPTAVIPTITEAVVNDSGPGGPGSTPDSARLTGFHPAPTSATPRSGRHRAPRRVTAAVVSFPEYDDPVGECAPFVPMSGTDVFEPMSGTDAVKPLTTPASEPAA